MVPILIIIVILFIIWVLYTLNNMGVEQLNGLFNKYKSKLQEKPNHEQLSINSSSSSNNKEYINKWLIENSHWYNKSDKKLNDTIHRVYSIVLPERLQHIKTFLQKSGIHNASLLKAFPKSKIPKNNKDLGNGQLVNNNYLNKKDANNKYINTGRVACHISHMMILRDFVYETSDDVKTALILEDDIKIPEKNITKDIDEFIHKTKDLEWDALFLGFCWEYQPHVVKEGIVKLITPRCQHAFIITKEAAKKVLEESLPMTEPNDEVLAKLIYSKKIKAYGSDPTIIDQNREDIGSSIGNVDSLNKYFYDPTKRSRIENIFYDRSYLYK